MTIKIDAGKFTRGEMFFIDPQEIIVDEKLNGRWKPHDKETIALRCKSFEEEGQLQPVQIRRVAENKVQLVSGYCRHAAAKLFNELHPDTPMKLKCVIVTINDEEAFRYNIVENKERKDTTPIDDAHNQRRLRDQFGWTDTKIADFYGVAQSYIGTLKKLLTLSKDKQKAIHAGQLSVNAAVSLADLPAEEQQAVWQQLPIAETAATEPVATETAIEVGQVSEPTPVAVTVSGNTSNGESISGRVVKAVREAKIEKGGKQARSLAEVRKFFENAKETPSLKVISETILKFIEGRLTDKTMEKKLTELFPVAENTNEH